MKVDELIKILTEKRFLYKKGKVLYLYRKHRYKNYGKYFKINKKNIFKFSLKGEAFISSLLNL